MTHACTQAGHGYRQNNMSSITPIPLQTGLLTGSKANRLIRHIESGGVQPARGMRLTSRGTIIRTGGRGRGSGVDNPKKWAFGVTVSAKTFTIYPGRVYLWNNKITLLGSDEAPTELEYTDATEYAYICVKIPIDTGTEPSIVGLSAAPTISSEFVYVPLVRAVSDDGGETYSIVSTAGILHRGDIHLTGPFVWT